MDFVKSENFNALRLSISVDVALDLDGIKATSNGLAANPQLQVPRLLYLYKNFFRNAPQAGLCQVLACECPLLQAGRHATCLYKCPLFWLSVLHTRRQECNTHSASHAECHEVLACACTSSCRVRRPGAACDLPTGACGHAAAHTQCNRHLDMSYSCTLLWQSTRTWVPYCRGPGVLCRSAVPMSSLQNYVAVTTLPASIYTDLPTVDVLVQAAHGRPWHAT